MGEVSFHRKRPDGLYEGHILTGDGMADMPPSYRLTVGKVVPPMFPVSKSGENASYYFVEKQRVDSMSAKERADLLQNIYFYETQQSTGPPADWCPPSDPQIPLSTSCRASSTSSSSLNPGAIAGITIGVIGALLLVAGLLHRRRGMK